MEEDCVPPRLSRGKESLLPPGAAASSDELSAVAAQQLADTEAQLAELREEARLWAAARARADAEYARWGAERAAYEGAVADEEAADAASAGGEREERVWTARLIREVLRDEGRVDLLHLQVAEGDERRLHERDYLTAAHALAASWEAAAAAGAHDATCAERAEAVAVRGALQAEVAVLSGRVEEAVAELDRWRAESLRMDCSPNRPNLLVPPPPPPLQVPRRGSASPVEAPPPRLPSVGGGGGGVEAVMQQQQDAAAPAATTTAEARDSERRRWAEARRSFRQRLQRKGGGGVGVEERRRGSGPPASAVVLGVWCGKEEDVVSVALGETLPAVTVRARGMPDVPVVLGVRPPHRLVGDTTRLLEGGLAVFESVAVVSASTAVAGAAGGGGLAPLEAREEAATLYVCYPSVGSLAAVTASTPLRVRRPDRAAGWRERPPRVVAARAVAGVAGAVQCVGFDEGESVAAAVTDDSVALAYRSGVPDGGWDVRLTLRLPEGVGCALGVQLDAAFLVVRTEGATLLWERRMLGVWLGKLASLPASTVRHTLRPCGFVCAAADGRLLVDGVWHRGGRPTDEGASAAPPAATCAAALGDDVFVGTAAGAVVRLPGNAGGGGGGGGGGGTLAEQEAAAVLFESPSGGAVVAVAAATPSPFVEDVCAAGAAVHVAAAVRGEGVWHVHGPPELQQQQQRRLAFADVADRVATLAFAHYGKVLVCGTTDGELLVLDVDAACAVVALPGRAAACVTQDGAVTRPLSEGFELGLLAAAGAAEGGGLEALTLRAAPTPAAGFDEPAAAATAAAAGLSLSLRPCTVSAGGPPPPPPATRFVSPVRVVPSSPPPEDIVHRSVSALDEGYVPPAWQGCGGGGGGRCCYLGLRVRDAGGTLRGGGAAVAGVVRDGPADVSGIPCGVVVVGVGVCVVRCERDFGAALAAVAAGPRPEEPLRVCYVSGSGDPFEPVREVWVVPSGERPAEEAEVVENDELVDPPPPPPPPARRFSRRHSSATVVSSSVASVEKLHQQQPHRRRSRSRSGSAEGGASECSSAFSPPVRRLRSATPVDACSSLSSAVAAAVAGALPAAASPWTDAERRNLSNASFRGTTPLARLQGFLKANGLPTPTPANDATLRKAVVAYLVRCKGKGERYVDWWALSRPPPEKLLR